MFETLSHLALQQYWWFIVSLLASVLVFLLFVQGGQSMIFSLGKSKMQKTMIVNAMGRRWETTFTTLVTFGGAFFASFPLFYSTSFGGAYWVWMLILLAFIIQAVSFEFRSKVSNFLGGRTYEVFLFINGVLGPLLLGAAVATFFTGSAFTVDKLNLSNIGGITTISSWNTPAHGLEAVLNVTNLALGLAVFFLARVLGILYLRFAIEDADMFQRSRKSLMINSAFFLVFFLYFLVAILIKEGFAVNPETGDVFMEKYKYLHNFLEMPVVLIAFLVGVVLVLWGIISTLINNGRKGIWFSGFGTVLAVLGLFMVAGYNNTAFYPAFPFDSSIAEDPEKLNAYIQSSLTIRNASSSKFTLTVMSYVSLLVPFVLAYTWYAWKSLARKPITEQEMQDDSHVY